MQELLDVLSRHGLLVVFLLTLASRIGVPVPAAPLLVVAGSLAANGRMSLAGIVLVSIAANVLADWTWYAAGRHYGSRIMRLVCRVSQSPDSCVRQSENLIVRWGGSSLVAAKFIPGVSVVAPPMTGAMRMPFWRFVIYDAFASLVWTALYVVLGMLFADQIQSVLNAMASASWVAAAIVGVLLVLFIAQRVWRRRRMRYALRMERITPFALVQRLQDGWEPLILDVRSRELANLDPQGLPGARRVDIADLRRQLAKEDRTRDIVVYCNCPNDASAAQAACMLESEGFAQVWPLAGGLDGWEAAGYRREPVIDYPI